MSITTRPGMSRQDGARLAAESGSDHRDSMEYRIGRAIKLQPNGCWLWTGPIRMEYGCAYVDGQQVTAHRWVYETLRRVKIPADMVLHHRCFEKLCMNPDHLEQMTSSDHMALHQALLKENPCRHSGSL